MAEKSTEFMHGLVQDTQKLVDIAATQTQQHGAVDPFIFGITVFVLACFVGYYVVWKVTPALHTPLMAVTNAISGIIVVGAMIALGAEGFGISSVFGFVAVVIASINIFGGFIVTQRMLQMFKKKQVK
ncbi:MAG: transhydrogenase (AB-specific) [Rickettsiales bacterium]|jgi:NAD(P) transhydrogenase subunit alpha|nr:transhydrogenase (AB-specific) [Rickettsiales bacterium]